jgi:hypothetical protein
VDGELMPCYGSRANERRMFANVDAEPEKGGDDLMTRERGKQMCGIARMGAIIKGKGNLWVGGRTAPKRLRKLTRQNAVKMWEQAPTQQLYLCQHRFHICAVESSKLASEKLK